MALSLEKYAGGRENGLGSAGAGCYGNGMSPWPLRVLIGGIVIALGAPLAGLVGTVLAMMGAFHTLGATGISDAKVLANDVAAGLMSTMIGLVISGAFGLPLIVVGIVLLAVRRSQPKAPPAL